MFQDFVHLQSLHHDGVAGHIGLAHWGGAPTFSHTGDPDAACKAHHHWYRPWAHGQGDGYMPYDNQLFWDHGFEYGGARYEDPTETDGDAPSYDHRGFIGWKCQGA